MKKSFLILILSLISCACLHGQVIPDETKKDKDYQEIPTHIMSTEGKVIDKFAMYPGGAGGLQIFVAGKVKYHASERNKQGTVTLEYTVDTLGQVKDIKIINSVSEKLDNEVVSALSKAENWEPAYSENTAVCSRYRFYMNFKSTVSF